MIYTGRYNYLRLYGYPVFTVFLYLILILLNSDESNLEGWKFYLVTDSVDEAVNYIQEHTIKQFNLKPQRVPYKPFKWLFEG